MPSPTYPKDPHVFFFCQCYSLIGPRTQNLAYKRVSSRTRVEGIFGCRSDSQFDGDMVMWAHENHIAKISTLLKMKQFFMHSNATDDWHLSSNPTHAVVRAGLLATIGCLLHSSSGMNLGKLLDSARSGAQRDCAGTAPNVDAARAQQTAPVGNKIRPPCRIGGRYKKDEDTVDSYSEITFPMSRLAKLLSMH